MEFIAVGQICFGNQIYWSLGGHMSFYAYARNIFMVTTVLGNNDVKF